jgi:hypothetical protein
MSTLSGLLTRSGNTSSQAYLVVPISLLTIYLCIPYIRICYVYLRKRPKESMLGDLNFTIV